METLPWEDGDPPDHQRWGVEEREVGAMVAVVLLAASRSVPMGSIGWGACDRAGVLSTSQRDAPCPRFRVSETPGWEHEAHSGSAPHCGVVEVGSLERMQLDLGLTDTIKYASYSKIWRMLYFVNDAPFRIRNCLRIAELCRSTSPSGALGIA